MSILAQVLPQDKPLQVLINLLRVDEQDIKPPDHYLMKLNSKLVREDK
jgi:hypothetical protein